MTAKQAANILESIRNDRSTDINALLSRVHEVGNWASSQKHSKLIGKILSECHALDDRLRGGSGCCKLRIEVLTPDQNHETICS